MNFRSLNFYLFNLETQARESPKQLPINEPYLWHVATYPKSYIQTVPNMDNE